MKIKAFVFLLFVAPLIVAAQPPVNPDSAFMRENFTKLERMITMRDGVLLYTAVYVPKDASSSNKYPFLFLRTPYSCNPYGENAFPRRLGPNSDLFHDKYIFVYQDVRGRYKSGGSFEEMTPHKAIKKTKQDVDESSDTYDTVDWLVKNITGNNGNVGLYGISYPGFYASASLPDAHPAIKAVSPQAPVTDEFMGDDANHNGAFFLLDNFDFMNYFGGERTDSGKDYNPVFNERYKDAYQYFLQLGPLKNSQGPKLYNNKVKIWNEYLQHDTYDSFWKARNIRTHLKNIKPAVLVVGGFFDAEDMFGALRTYEAIEKQSPANNNHLLMGPWTHGAWARGEWNKFGTMDFGSDLNAYYKKIETDFFTFNLKNKGKDPLKEATIFVTGDNAWKQFDTWPPTNTKATAFYFAADGKFDTARSMNAPLADRYVSDPSKPVPYINFVSGRRRNEYLVDDQRFAAQRPDVLTYQTTVLDNDVTVVGKINADLFVSLLPLDKNGSKKLDADFIVKLIDVLPDNEPNPKPNPEMLTMAGFQRMIRAEVFRGKFRNSFEKPEAFEPGKVSEVKFDLNEVAHTFKKGHRIMVQVQSSWFPLVDRNPQTFLKIPEAKASDFQSLLIELQHAGSKIVLPVVE